MSLKAPVIILSDEGNKIGKFESHRRRSAISRAL